MQYQLAPLFCRAWTLNGITPRLIESHYEGNYGSALRRLNAITEELEALDLATASVDVINRLKRDEGSMLCVLGRRAADKMIEARGHGMNDRVASEPNDHVVEAGELAEYRDVLKRAGDTEPDAIARPQFEQ